MTEEIESLENEQEEQEYEQRLIILGNEEKEEDLPRLIGIYGEISEATTAGTIQDLYKLQYKGKIEDEEGNISHEPIEFIISTEGGHVAEMFSLYDVFRKLQSEGTEISTFGIGKVMSAGVLLLASGTKGKRKIGRHTQVMIHDISSGHFGTTREIQNDTKQIRKLREVYIDCLVNETKMTKRKISRYFNKHVDVYFTAEEAVEMGIADIIV